MFNFLIKIKKLEHFLMANYLASTNALNAACCH